MSQNITIDGKELTIDEKEFTIVEKEFPIDVFMIDDKTLRSTIHDRCQNQWSTIDETFDCTIDDRVSVPLIGTLKIRIIKRNTSIKK